MTGSGSGRAFPGSRSRKTDGSQLSPGAGAGTDPFRQIGSQSAELTLGSWSIRVNIQDGPCLTIVMKL